MSYRLLTSMQQVCCVSRLADGIRTFGQPLKQPHWPRRPGWRLSDQGALNALYNFTDVIEAPLDIEEDGFLAVNSLLAVCVLLARAYRLAAQRRDPMRDRFESLMANVDAGTDFDADVRRVLKRKTISLLYSPILAAAATDLESRFVEGALGNLHAADWRNFGHGRHHWL